MNIQDDEILYSTVEQQIEKLKSQNLIIDDIELAKKALNLYGYFNLIKGYRDPYVIISNDSTTYRSGITFEQITSLYILDKNLRNAVIAAMLDLEEHLKAATADVISSSFGVHQDDYLQFRNYRDKRRRKKQFTLANILNTMKDAIQTDKNPVCHYRNCHGIIPPWVLFKNIYFSTIVNYINLFKTSEKKELITHLYDIENLPFTIEQLQRIMMDTLFICLEYRNLAAHGGRTYNYICNSSLDYDNYPFNESNGPKGFSQLLFLLELLNYKNPYEHLAQTLEDEVNRHCNEFPQDMTYLAQILNIDIIPKKIAWVTDASDKYHSNPHCSGINNSYPLPLDEIIKKEYKPCKKCFK